MPPTAPLPNLPFLTPRQRWLAAEQLAADAPHVLAATFAGVDESAIDQLLAADPSFGRLVDACRAIHEMPRADWRRRFEGLLRTGAERAVADGRVSTVNLALRTLGALEPDEADDDEEELGDGPLANLPPAMVAGLSRAQIMEYMALNEDEPEEDDPPPPPPSPPARASDRGADLEPPCPPTLSPTPLEDRGQGDAPAAEPPRAPAAAPREGSDLACSGPRAVPAEPYSFPDEPSPARKLASPPPPAPPKRAREPVPSWHHEQPRPGWYRAQAP